MKKQDNEVYNLELLFLILLLLLYLIIDKKLL